MAPSLRIIIHPNPRPQTDSSATPTECRQSFSVTHGGPKCLAFVSPWLAVLLQDCVSRGTGSTGRTVQAQPP